MSASDDKAAEREARLAARLRDNLRRRKQQARGAVAQPVVAGSQALATPEEASDGAAKIDPPLPNPRSPS